MDDWQLIEDYAQRGSEAAFRTLVERHIHLVRSSAFRQVNDAQQPVKKVCGVIEQERG